MPLLNKIRNSYRIVGNEVFISLKRKIEPPLETVIDLADFPKVEAVATTWFLQWNVCTSSYYANGHLGRGAANRIRIGLHRFILDTPIGLDTDHFDHDTLNNKRNNLRAVTRRVNILNSAHYFNRDLPPYFYLTHRKQTSYKKSPWHASYRPDIADTRRNHIGCFQTREEAVAAILNLQLSLAA